MDLINVLLGLLYCYRYDQMHSYHCIRTLLYGRTLTSKHIESFYTTEKNLKKDHLSSLKYLFCLIFNIHINYKGTLFFFNFTHYNIQH